MKTTPETGYGVPEKETPEKIYQKLLERLPEVAKTVIDDRSENDNFKQNPDDPKEHDVSWHQFGIVTHTEKFSQFFQTEAQEYFQKWNVDEKINQKLSESIDGKTKAELLHISIPLHDLGKFARGFMEKDGKIKPDYKGHEAKSEKLIRENEQIHDLLQETYGLTEAQIDYIACCAGLHYELGKTRDEAKKTDMGYTIAFAKSEQCQKACNEIAQKFPEFKEEIGILFLCDNLAKTDVRIDAETDEEIEKQTQRIENIIQERNLNSKLVAAIKQRPVNIAIAKRYLENIIK